MIYVCKRLWAVEQEDVSPTPQTIWHRDKGTRNRLQSACGSVSSMAGGGRGFVPCFLVDLTPPWFSPLAANTFFATRNSQRECVYRRDTLYSFYSPRQGFTFLVEYLSRRSTYSNYLIKRFNRFSGGGELEKEVIWKKSKKKSHRWSRCIFVASEIPRTKKTALNKNSRNGFASVCVCVSGGISVEIFNFWCKW